MEELKREEKSLSGLREELQGRRGDVEKLEELASKFEMETEVWENEGMGMGQKLTTSM